jgi:hypothetical protein
VSNLAHHFERQMVQVLGVLKSIVARTQAGASRALPASRREKLLRALFSKTILAGVLAGSAMAQAPDAGCALPSEPKGIPAALDAAITGPADKGRACMKALFIREARMMFVSLGADETPSYRLETLDDWIARVKARGHAMLEEKQLKFHIERYGNIAHLWSSYPLYSDGKQVARGINSIQAIKEAGGWRVTGVMVQASRVGHCAAAQGISAVRNNRTIVFQADPGYCPYTPNTLS